MKRLIVFLIPFCIVLMLDGVGFGDRVNLTELKKKEEERRKKVKKSEYKLTNGNLNSIKVPQKKYAFVQMYTPTGSLALEEEDSSSFIALKRGRTKFGKHSKD